jgi:hypothetical protein
VQNSTLTTVTTVTTATTIRLKEAVATVVAAPDKEAVEAAAAIITTARLR